jgi:hypothetical protein
MSCWTARTNGSPGGDGAAVAAGGAACVLAAGWVGRAGAGFGVAAAVVAGVAATGFSVG